MYIYHRNTFVWVHFYHFVFQFPQFYQLFLYSFFAIEGTIMTQLTINLDRSYPFNLINPVLGNIQNYVQIFMLKYVYHCVNSNNKKMWKQPKHLTK